VKYDVKMSWGGLALDDFR